MFQDPNIITDLVGSTYLVSELQKGGGGGGVAWVILDRGCGRETVCTSTVPKLRTGQVHAHAPRLCKQVVRGLPYAWITGARPCMPIAIRSLPSVSTLPTVYIKHTGASPTQRPAGQESVAVRTQVCTAMGRQPHFFFTPGRRWVEKPLPHSRIIWLR